jgi:HK97 family phage major capsid protein
MIASRISTFLALALALSTATATATKNLEEMQAPASPQNPVPPKGKPDTRMAPGVRVSHWVGAFRASPIYFEDHMNLEELKRRKAAIAARLNELVALARTEQRTMTVDETAEYTTLEGELDSVEASIPIAERHQARDTLESLEVARPRGFAAAPAVLTKTTRAERNGGKFKGHEYVAFIAARALAVARGVDLATVAPRFAQGRPDLQKEFRKWAANEVPGGGEKSGEWGSELVHSDQYLGDFIELLRERTVFDQLGLREVPANVTIKGQDGTGIAYWVGEGAAIPMSKDDFSSVSLAPLKVGALSAISLELLEDSSPSALQLVQDSLIADSAQLIDSRFFSATAASSGVSPAGIVNGVSGTASAGTDAQGLITDCDVLTQAFITAKNTGGLKFVSRPALAQKISGFMSFAGAPLFPGLSEVGGTLQQKPYLTSDNVVSGDLLLVKPSDIFRIGDRGLSLEISREATLEFASDPTGSALANGSVPVAQSKQPVNLFQAGMIGVRLIRRINWAKRRSSAVARITGAAYVPQVQTA